MPDKEMTFRGPIAMSDLDQLGRIKPLASIARFDQAGWVFLAAIGFTPSWFRSSPHGLSLVHYEFSYEDAEPGDVVEVLTHLVRVGRSSLEYVHELRNSQSGQVVARARATGVLIDRVTRRSVAFPDADQTRLRALVI